MNSEESTDKAIIQVPWGRHQWLKLVAVIEDHPKLSLSALAGIIGLLLFYGIVLGGFSHFSQALARWRIDSFGGSLKVDRSVRTPDVILSLRKVKYNRLDAVALTGAHFGGTAFRAELRRLTKRDGGLIRIVGLDPRVSDPDHPQHAPFKELAEAFGMDPAEFGARCWYSASVLHHLHRELGDGFQIRWLTAPSESASHPYFCIGRSGHAYRSEDPKERLDVIVPRPAKPTRSDTFTHPGQIFKNRPDDPEVLRFTNEFKTLWSSASALENELNKELTKRLDGAPVTGN